jgi:hypothetical protein
LVLIGLLWLVDLLGACMSAEPSRELSYEFAGRRVPLSALAQIASERCRRASPPEQAPPPIPFSTDGCSVGPSGGWSECCIAHDMVYWCGGTDAAREAADQALRACVVGHGGDEIARWMYLGVRLGGADWLPFPWRWGYGHPWPHVADDPPAQSVESPH